MQRPIALEVAGPFHWFEGEGVGSLFASPLAEARGIYIWVVPVAHVEQVLYVGETGRSFCDRFREHLFAELSGQYDILDPVALRNGRHVVLWRGTWRRDDNARFREFFDRHAALLPQIHELIRSFRFYLVEFGGPDRVRLRIEAAIAQHLRSQQPGVADFLEPGIRYQPRRYDEVPIAVTLVSPERVVGLPISFTA